MYIKGMRALSFAVILLVSLAACAAPGSQPGATVAPAAGATTPSAAIRLTSPAFIDGQPIPVEYTCQGAGRAPELAWSGVPAGAKSLALIVDDPDAPAGTFVHWVLANLPPTAAGLPAGAPAPAGAVEGLNGARKPGYTGPCPPAGKVHHYIFTLYAVDQVLVLGAAPDKDALSAALQGHVLAISQLVGTYQR